jgi:hypothetical protein
MPDSAQTQEVAERAKIVHPATGETLTPSLTATDELARAYREVQDLEAELKDFKRDIATELLGRMDHEATYTVHLGGGRKLVGDGPASDEYDGAVLNDALRPLLREGVIGPVAYGNAVKREVSYKAMKRGVSALLKLGNARVTAAVKSAAKPPKPRRVRIEEAPR